MWLNVTFSLFYPPALFRLSATVGNPHLTVLCPGTGISLSQVEMGICGGSGDAHKEVDTLEAGRPCTGVRIDVALHVGEVNGGSCGQ